MITNTLWSTRRDPHHYAGSTRRSVAVALIALAACGADPRQQQPATALVKAALAPSADGFSQGVVFRLAHTAVGATDLSNFQVRVQVDTAAEINAGRMRSDCADIRVFAGNSCEAGTGVSFWVADGTCNTTKTDVWLGLPSVLAGSTTSFAMYWGTPGATSQSNGPAVFPIFFDDFNGASIDTNKWNLYSNKLNQTNGILSTSGGASALWTKQKVMAQGQTVFGVRTNAISAGGADIEYGASTLIAEAPDGYGGAIHFASRTYTGVTFMSWDQAEALIGRGTSGGQCERQSPGAKWANTAPDSTWFQTEFFYEYVANNQTKFGIYDKFGVKRGVTMGSAGCKPPATESAYYQFDHSSGPPNPVSSLDYAYVRKYANPDPVERDRTPLAQAQCSANGMGACNATSASAVCASGSCSLNGGVCVPGTAGACYVDADCGNGQFCNRQSYTCTNKLATGTALPSDGLHDTCSSNSTNAACSSGLCNGTTSTCADVNGSACTMASQCTVNVCASDAKCGYASGGSCTAQSADRCRSSCGPSGVCLPPGGCDSDSACSAGSYCDLTSLTCLSDASNGASIPSDHGTCGGTAGAAGPAIAVCSSGACNASTNTCAGPNDTTTCTTDAECVSDVCGSDQKCGLPEGASGCTSTTETDVCRSQTCSLHGGTCIPSGAGKCWVDADCASNQFCARQSFTCTPQLAKGATLPSDNLHAACPSTSINTACASGLCNQQTGTCAAPNDGACSAAAECVTNVCDGDGKCGYPNNAGTCTTGSAAPQCRSGRCGMAGRCISAAAGGCGDDSDCSGGDYCVPSSDQCAPRLSNGNAIPSGHGTCGGVDGSYGPSVGACTSGMCNAAANKCAGPNTSTSCSAAIECVANFCGANHQCGAASGEGSCSDQNQADLCQSGKCSTTGSVCIPSGPTGCWLDADCSGNGDYCDQAHFTCTGRLLPGTALPGDGLHNACPQSEVNAACASGKCNRITSTCALGFTEACGAAADCVSNVCDTDSQCGYADGDGPCTDSDQLAVCRSGVCSSARCVPSGGCGHDDDCAAGSFCRSSDFACAVDLSDGTLIPASHGVCGGSAGAYGSAADVCASGSCNITSNTCAGANSSASCSVAYECVSNICGQNGKCGYVDGAGSACTSENAAANCQSGHCSANAGKCVPASDGSCWVDTDCGDGAYCHRSTFACEARILPGSAVPTDDYHAACPPNGANAACSTGHCSPTSGLCVAANGDACSEAKGCGSNICGQNGKCGYSDGTGPCGDADATSVCQSGSCSAQGNVCIPTGEGGCYVDLDCGDGRFCQRASFHCASTLAAGASLPDDGLHATCGEVGESAACATGLCDSSSQKCVAASGADCSSDDQCLAKVCGSNGKCGHEDGAGPCTAADAKTVCQSGACSAQSKVCIASGEAKCWVDEDCGEGSYCDRASATCSAPHSGGEAIPDDGLHQGCSDDGTSAACASGRCDPDSDLCVSLNGSSCDSDAACLSGACGSNGECGHVDGEGPCDSDNAETVCQSGHCSPTGHVCMSGSCWADKDCPSNQYCDRSNQTCAAQVQAGGRLPSDGVHDACEEAAKNGACSTGYCENGRCVEDTSAFSITGGGGCSTLGPARDESALLTLCLAALAWTIRPRRRRRS